MKKVKIISGGQTGTDKAALDLCLRKNIPCGGYCPPERIAEDGSIPKVHPLQEVTTDEAQLFPDIYAARAFKNVKESDATLIFTTGAPCGGTLLTITYTKSLQKPYYVINLNSINNITFATQRLMCWSQKVASDRDDSLVLNTAGPRESESPRVSELTRSFLEEWIPHDPLFHSNP